jgi:prophage regulatory protein
MTSPTLLRIGHIQQRLGIGRTLTYEWVSEGLLPPPVRIGERLTAWPEHEIDAVITARTAGASEDEIRKLVARLVAARKQAWAHTRAELAQAAQEVA